MYVSKRKFMMCIISVVLFVVLVYTYNRYRQLDVQNVIAYGILLIAGIFCIFRGIKEDYIINPYILFTIVPVSLLMYDITVSKHYLVELRSDTYNLAIYNTVMVLLGFSVGGCVKFHYGNVWEKGEYQDESHLSRHGIRLMFLGLFPTLYGCVFGLGHLVSLDLNSLKAVVNSMPLSSIFQLFLYLGLMISLKSKDRKAIILSICGIAISVIINFSKTTVVMASICLLIFFYDLSQSNRKVRKYFIISVISALVLVFASFTIYNNIRFDYDINEYFDNLGYVGNVSNNLFLPIMYVISPWCNLQYIVDTTTSYSSGLWILKPFLGYLQLDQNFGNAFELVPRFGAFNTYTFISVYYRDFGFVGSGICSFVLAMYIMYIYKLKRKFADSPYVSTIFALNMYATVMMFFNNHFQQLSYPFTIYIISYVWLKVTRAEYKEEDEFET